MSQALQALELANVIRIEQARIRRWLTAQGFVDGPRRCAELLTNPPLEVLSMRLNVLLTAIHRYGPQRIANLLYEADVLTSALERRVRALSTRQRRDLAAVLRGQR